VMSIVFICDFDMRAFFEPFMTLRHIGFIPHKPRRELHKCHLHSFLISQKMWYWFIALNTDHSSLRRDVEIHTFYQLHMFHITR